MWLAMVGANVVYYAPESVIICPHCTTTARFSYVGSDVIRDSNHTDQDEMEIMVVRCEHCHGLVATIEIGHFEGLKLAARAEYIWPQPPTRSAPAEGPDHIARNFHEAAALLDVTPRASAAVARRCLRAVLSENGLSYLDHVDFSEQLEAAGDLLPAYLVEGLESVRGREPGRVVDVEPGETEWLVEMLEALFEYFYVAPARMRRRRDGVFGQAA